MERTDNINKKHIKIKIFRILSYLIVYGIFGVSLFIYLRGYISIILLAVFIVVPVCEVIVAIKLYDSVKVSLSVSDNTLYIRDRLGIGINVENSSLLSALNLMCEIKLDNLYFDLKQSQRVIIPIHPRKTISHPVIFDTNYIGLIQAQISRYVIKDVFGFVEISDENPGNFTYISILPQLKEAEDSIKESLVMGVNDNEDNTRKGNEFAETGNIREYVPGDRIKDIHWKLSAKRDFLLVMERISTSESRLVLWIGSSNGKKVCEMILSVALEIMNTCVNESRLMKVLWFDYHNRCVDCIDVATKKDVFFAFEKIYLGGHGEQPDNAPSLLATAGYQYKNVLGIGFDGDDIKVNLYEA